MKPTHNLKALNKKTNARTNCGVGWLNEDGSITIVLNPYIVMQPDKDIVINLFPILQDK